MKHPTMSRIIDTLSFIGFLFLTSTGILLHYLLPPGSGRWSTIWDLNRHQWGEIHFWISVVFFIVLSLHLILHWKFIVSLIKGHQPTGSKLRMGLGITGFITILLLAAAPLVSPVNETERSAAHQHRQIPQ